MTSTIRNGAIASLATLLAGDGALAGDVSVIITGVRDAGGEIRVAACEDEEFLRPDCFRSAAIPAQAGTVELTLHDVPPGTYALQAFHDVDGNGEIDTNLFGVPREGMGFSNDARMRFGPPEFSEAAVTIGPSDRTVRFTMRYLD